MSDLFDRAVVQQLLIGITRQWVLQQFTKRPQDGVETVDGFVERSWWPVKRQQVADLVVGEAGPVGQLAGGRFVAVLGKVGLVGSLEV